MSLNTLLAGQKDLFIRNKKGVLLFVYTIFFMLYLGIGGLFFILIEGPQIEKSQKDILDAKTKILQKYPNIPGEALDAYLNELRSLGVRGLPDPKTTTIAKWTFADAVFFATTLLTTIGYGHVTPRSTLGKMICMIYTGFGIPVTLMLLASFVERLMRLSESYKAALFRKMQKMKPLYIRLTHISSIMALILVFCFLLPALVFAHFEKDWGLFDGIYFCFISLTTVGLGDLVPALDVNMPNVDVYKYGATFFLLAGITVMMFMMALSADFHQNYSCCYETIPYTISSEKISINPNSAQTYGSILTQSGKSEDEKIERIIMPP